MTRNAWLVLAVALAALGGCVDRSPPPESPAGGDEEILRAFEERRSNVQVGSSGTVDRILSDDLQGSRHQRFIVRLAGGHTLLFAHNIDLAPRVPLEVGDRVAFFGEYEWNEKGGVVHWTHHDPDGEHPDGWIEHEGKRYQ